jgi:hypothetical protein
MAVDGLFLVNAYYILLYVTHTNESSGYLSSGKCESSSYMFTSDLTWMKWGKCLWELMESHFMGTTRQKCILSPLPDWHKVKQDLN